jgi:hypothetical protein
MEDQVYRELMQKFARRGGRYPGMDIPEFYEMARALFSPEEASVAAAMPKGFSTAEQLTQALDRNGEEVESLLQTMAAKGLCASGNAGGTEVYVLPPFVPGIFEYQFMRGTKTEHDLRLAKLIHKYKEAVDAINGIPEISFPPTRVIAVDEKIDAGNKIHTYDQMSHYVENADPISVCTCYCRHEAALLDEEAQRCLHAIRRRGPVHHRQRHGSRDLQEGGNGDSREIRGSGPGSLQHQPSEHRLRVQLLRGSLHHPEDCTGTAPAGVGSQFGF